ncbi:MAG TPA: hypothetical protein VL854_09305, partial [Nitrososphaeraceae archaeon]|nr:hypothetical protein [Nitrososphaeraceae archaeon]
GQFGQAIVAKSHYPGVTAESSGNNGVIGSSTYMDAGHVGVGVLGQGPYGVRGVSTKGFTGVVGDGGVGGTGVFGIARASSSGAGGIAVHGRGTIAGRFEGDVEVTGDIKLLNPQNADCAEDFDILEVNVEPGTVMVLAENGSLQSSHQEYDKKVVGIISGAGGYNPAIVLNRHNQSQNQNQNEKKEDNNKLRLPLALMGKVYCKVDATHSPIAIGDLLTTSSTKGYAMKANDVTKAFGAVLGKALGCISEGLGMIPVLVTLQ